MVLPVGTPVPHGPDPSSLGVSSSQGHRWLINKSLETPGSSPLTIQTGTPSPQRGRALPGVTQKVWCHGRLRPAASGEPRAFTPASSPPPPGSPSSSWFRVFHSRLMGAAPSWMRHLKLASWPCRTVLLGGSIEMTGLLRPGGGRRQRAALSRAGWAPPPPLPTPRPQCLPASPCPWRLPHSR